MHHLLPFYGKYQSRFLKTYMALARLVKIPIIGTLVRYIANIYARRQHGGYLITQKEAEAIIDSSDNILLGPCCCRQVFGNCQRPVMAEIIVGAGREVYSENDSHNYKEISKQEARQIISRCHNEGMIHSIMHCRGLYYAICNCCTCCCVPYRLKNEYGIEYSFGRNGNIVDEYKNQRFLARRGATHAGKKDI